MKFYAGIGSRETPGEILSIMTALASKLEKYGWILRSGHADGADMAFEKGCTKNEIYMPWRGFNNAALDFGIYNWTKGQLQEAEKHVRTVIADDHWNNMTQGARKLHLRNFRQVFGTDMINPSKFIVCWTKDGKPIGGTRTAILLAQKHGIPVHNLAIKSELDKICNYLKK